MVRYVFRGVFSHFILFPVLSNNRSRVSAHSLSKEELPHFVHRPGFSKYCIPQAVQPQACGYCLDSRNASTLSGSVLSCSVRSAMVGFLFIVIFLKGGGPACSTRRPCYEFFKSSRFASLCQPIGAALLSACKGSWFKSSNPHSYNFAISCFQSRIPLFSTAAYRDSCSSRTPSIYGCCSDSRRFHRFLAILLSGDLARSPRERQHRLSRATTTHTGQTGFIA